MITFNSAIIIELSHIICLENHPSWLSSSPPSLIHFIRLSAIPAVIEARFPRGDSSTGALWEYADLTAMTLTLSFFLFFDLLHMLPCFNMQCGHSFIWALFSVAVLVWAHGTCHLYRVRITWCAGCELAAFFGKI